jgi:hypothetical protein
MDANRRADRAAARVAARALQRRAQTRRVLLIVRYVAVLATFLIIATGTLIESLYQREPYHTSILTGEGWVLELISGNPRRIPSAKMMPSYMLI